MRVVIHHEDALARSLRRTRGLGLPRGLGDGDARGLFGHRNGERELRAQARSVAVGPHPSSVRLYDALADGKAQTGTLHLALAVLAGDGRKLPEKVGQAISGDPSAFIGDGNTHIAIFPHGGEADGSGRFGVAGGVGKKVIQHLDDATPIRHDPRQPRREINLDSTPPPTAQKGVSRLIDEADHVRRFRRDRERAGLDLCHVNQVADQVPHAIGLVVDDSVELSHFHRVETRRGGE